MTRSPAAPNAHLFVRDGARFLPTPHATGPWRSDAMHGGATGALVGQLIDANIEAGTVVARVVLDLEAPVPMEPLQAAVTPRRVSRRVTHLDVVLTADGRRVASARALTLRPEPLPTPEWELVDRSEPLPGPEATVRPEGPMHGGPIAYHCDAVELRFVVGGFGLPGPGVAWVRLVGHVIDDEPTSGLAALFAAADFGSALSQSLPRENGIGLINVDVSVSLHRTPVGPWIRLASTGAIHPAGTGLAMTELGDLHGPLGVGAQAQLGYHRPST